MKFRLQENLRELLKSKGWRAADLARASGVSPSVISEWMAGRKPRSISNLKKISEQLQVSIEELCFEKSAEGKTPRRGPKTRDLLPMILPINESGLLELQLRWTAVEKNAPEKE